MKKAFTLIELLVVIAIIAILAAILFPVFAQAKVAAKGAASLSNAKQMGTGSFIYNADYDDLMPIKESWSNDGIWCYSGACFRPWGVQIMPYIKNGQIFQDPLASPERVPTTPAFVANQPNNYLAAFSQFGYNYTVWSPYAGSFTAPIWIPTPQSQTSIGSPAETVLFASRASQAEMGLTALGITWYGPNTLMSINGVEPPDCSSRPEWCFAGWGVSMNYTPVITTREAGKWTGGVARRKSGQHIVVMGDSSTRSMPAGRLAAGTNFADNTTQTETQITVTDRSRYLWDNQ